MFNRLKLKLQKWLEVGTPDQDAPVNTLECLIGGQVRRMGIVGICGLRLQVSDRESTYLVGAGQAVDQALFWRAWRQRNTAQFAWEDGTEFKPGEQ